MLKEAIILAGGFGTRLREVVADVPKPIAPVNQKPFLDYILNYLKFYGIEKVVLSVGYLSEKITEQYGGDFNGIKITYCVETQPLGTGGGIRMAMKHCTSSKVLVLNGDSFFDVNLRSFHNHHEDSVADCSLALRNVDNASRYGTIKLGEMDIITSFHEKSGAKAPGLINAGVYILGREAFLEETNGQTVFSIEKDFFEKKLDKLSIYGFTYQGYFIDIGIPEDYRKAQNDFKEFKYR
ncbi:MAG: nucleotidyltransferase family protein [Bacteroidia bacterium]